MGMAIFLNILAVLILIVSIFFFNVTRKWSIKEVHKIEKKKKEIEDILNSADEMIDELNKFSDYIITHIEDKAHEIEKMLVKIDVKVSDTKSVLSSRQNVVQREKRKHIDNNENQTIEKTVLRTIVPFENKGIVFDSNKINSYKSNLGANQIENKTAEKIINSNLKSKKIIILAEKGFSEAEIARKLNIGRGEIQLVLGMKNGTEI